MIDYEKLLIKLLYSTYKEKLAAEKLDKLTPYKVNKYDFPKRNFKKFSLANELNYFKPEYTLLKKIQKIKGKLKEE